MRFVSAINFGRHAYGHEVGSNSALLRIDDDDRRQLDGQPGAHAVLAKTLIYRDYISQPAHSTDLTHSRKWAAPVGKAHK